MGALAATAALVAGQESPQPPATPQFKAGVDLVTVDVSVVDDQGNPTVGLDPADFALKVDGAPRSISRVEFIRQSASTGPATSDVWSTNEGAAGGRLIMLIVDQGNIRRNTGQAFVRAADRLLSDLGPGDRVALAVIPGSQVVDFTSHVALVRERLRQITGTAAPTLTRRQVVGVGLAEALALDRGDESVARELAQRECAFGNSDQQRQCLTDLLQQASELANDVKQRTANSMTALRQLLTKLQTVPGPKTLILLSEGLVIDRSFDAVSWVRGLAATARVSLYAIHLDDTFLEMDTSMARGSPSTNEDRRLRTDGLFALAGLARGATFSVIGGSEGAFVRLSRELTGYYLLGFEPTPAERDGQPHEVSVEVKRRGVEVRARRIFTVDAASSAERTAEQRLGESLRLPLLSTEVPVRVATYNLPDPAGQKVRVLVSAGFGRSSDEVPVTAVAYRVVDQEGRLVSGRADPVPIRTGGDQRYLGTVVVDPGTFTIKFAATDADGRVGSVEHQFKASLNSAGTLSYGDLLLIDPVAGAENALRPMINPTVTGDTLVAYLELGSRESGALGGVTAGLEIAADANAPAILKAPLGVEPGATPDRRVAQGALSVAALPPGAYVARTTLLVDGKPVARVVRAFEFDPSAEVRARGSSSSASTRALPGSRVPFDRDAVLTAPVLEYFLQPLTAGTKASSTVVQQALARVQSGQPAELADVVAESQDTDATSAVIRGVGLYARGQLEPAAEAFRRALRIDSESSAAAFYLGACYAAGGRDREAVGAWQTTLASDEDAPFVYSLASDAYLRLKDAPAAADLAEEAYQRWPDDRTVRLQYARAAAVAGHRQEALRALDRHLAKEPRDQESLLLGLRILYETLADGKTIDSPAQDKALFDRYLGLYRTANGPDLVLVERWRDALWGTRPAPRR